MNPRLLLIAAASVPLAIGQLNAVAQCDTLDFEGILSGTNFTNQYQSCGVVFSSNGIITPPVTYDYGSLSWTSVLHSYDWYGELRMDFVDPADGVTPVPVGYVSFDNSVGSEIDYIMGTAYDVNGIALTTFYSISPERIELNIGGAGIAYIVLDDDQNTAYVIDNIVIAGAEPGAVQEHTASGFTVAPTLTEETITVRTGNGQPAEFWIIASDGRPVQRINTTDAVATIDVRHLASGAYTVVCSTDRTAHTARFVKM
ncbi:MAG: T9SS type A sorting domain-containing protein [Flavobacteriales bacterium]